MGVSKRKTAAEKFLEDKKGLYVPHLVDSAGIGSVSGIFVGAESFRGKCVAYTEWLAETGFEEDCYMDRDPDELLELGIALDKAADHYEANCERITAEIKEDIKTIKSAADWCRFWGEHGHGMHAWY